MRRIDSGRSDSFIKVKCHRRRNSWSAAIAPSTAMPRAIGALVAGYYRDGKLIYAGRVGTGYTRAAAKDLWKRLHPLEIAKPPFDEIPPVEARRRDVRWVEPKMVIEAAFPRLDQRRHGAAGRVQGRARGQAGEGGRARACRPRRATRRRRRRRAAAQSVRQRSAKKSKPVAKRRRVKNRQARGKPAPGSRKRRRPLHPSGPRLLGRRRRHQAGPRRLLHARYGTGWRRMS